VAVYGKKAPFDIKMIASLDIENEHWQYVHVLSMFRSPKDY
jgi:hypothetical protein